MLCRYGISRLGSDPRSSYTKSNFYCCCALLECNEKSGGWSEYSLKSFQSILSSSGICLSLLIYLFTSVPQQARGRRSGRRKKSDSTLAVIHYAEHIGLKKGSNPPAALLLNPSPFTISWVMRFGLSGWGLGPVRFLGSSQYRDSRAEPIRVKIASGKKLCCSLHIMCFSSYCAVLSPPFPYALPIFSLPLPSELPPNIPNCFNLASWNKEQKLRQSIFCSPLQTCHSPTPIGAKFL